MEPNGKKTGNWFLMTASILVWFALIAQLYLTIINPAVAVQESVIRYFSYFTILTNILVALCFSSALLTKGRSTFFTVPKTLTATAVYITVVALIYNLILRFTWKPEGLQMVVDELLHFIIPMLYILYWVIFVPKASLNWKDTFTWLIYPFIYLIFILFRGSVSGFYPYPFVDMGKYSYDTVLVNCFYVLILFLVLSFLYVWVGKKLSKRTS